MFAEDLTSITEAARSVQLLGGAWLAFLILKLVLGHVGRRALPRAPEPAKAPTGNGASGEQGVNFWVEKIRSIHKSLIQELVLPGQERLSGLMDNVSARQILLDAEIRALFEAQVKQLEEIIRQGRETADMVRARHERDAAARAAMEVSLTNYRRDIADLTKMVQKLLDRGGD